jgi:hypothetical protein
MKSKIHEYRKSVKSMSKTRTILLLVVTFPLWGLGCISCTKEADKGDPIFALPPETQTGANTFGVTIRGKVYVPRDPTGVNYGGSPAKGIYLTGLLSVNRDYTEIVVLDGASSVGFKLIIHIENPAPTGVYLLKQSNFRDQVDSILENHIYFKIWDANISNYAYYGSVESQSVLKITRRDNGIISGNFSGLFARDNNPSDKIQITDGRFDINSFTIQNKAFP